MYIVLFTRTLHRIISIFNRLYANKSGIFYLNPDALFLNKFLNFQAV
ncbi:hypothetical protein AHMF7616_02237 [Adhaeribacter pallidiroseus]|uniref:Uncharacterized protein n=1 Tax=Adhaeribacter pallidiroseus TaxID=2072847 RepID=A0A369QGT5_9BACT|nr:hypothetical protein AHMF7616_02237 [Adhaeribacter pallidiroseus]